MNRMKFDRTHIVVFAAGVVLALGGVSAGAWIPDANADQYSCIRTDLNAKGMSGNIPDPAFTIIYDVPECYAKAGYVVDKVSMRGDQVAVHYKKK